MNEIENKLEEKLRQGFKILNRFMLCMWRLGLGSWINFCPKVVGRIMVIIHTGRKTGLRRQTPVNYALVDGQLYCIAGFGGISDWYRNILANPQVEVWLPDGWWSGVADEVQDPEARLPLLRQVLVASGFAAFAAGINPYTLSDEQLAQISQPYILLHIRRTEARAGAGGPGELAWVWPLSTMLLLPLLFLKGRRARQ